MVKGEKIEEIACDSDCKHGAYEERLAATFWLPLRTANYGTSRFTSEIKQGARQGCKRGYCDEGVLQGCAAVWGWEVDQAAAPWSWR
jgi:hypothetical protein